MAQKMTITLWWDFLQWALRETNTWGGVKSSLYLHSFTFLSMMWAQIWGLMPCKLYFGYKIKSDRGSSQPKTQTFVNTKPDRRKVRSLTCYWEYQRTCTPHCLASHFFFFFCYWEKTKCCNFRPFTGSHIQFSNHPVSLK